jgi:hypothetical protein
MCSSGGAVAPVHHRCNGPCRRHVISIRGVGNGASPLIHVSPRGNVKLPRLIAVAAPAPTARGSCFRSGYNNNNDALLSQTWVIAKATVLRVRTVPYVEPYTFG